MRCHGVSQCAKNHRNRSKALLTVHDTPNRWLSLIHDNGAYKVIGIAIDNSILPKFFDVFFLPRIRALKTWNVVISCLENFSQLLIETGDFHRPQTSSRTITLLGPTISA